MLTRLGPNETELHAAIAGFCVMDEALKNAVGAKADADQAGVRAFKLTKPPLCISRGDQGVGGARIDAIPAFS